MFIKLYKIETLDNYFFSISRFFIILMAAVSVTFIILNWEWSIAIPTLAIFLTPCMFISLKSFRNNVFSVLLILVLFLYIYIPLTYASVMGEDYIFGWGLLNKYMPYSQEEYMNSYLTNLYFLFTSILSAFIALSLFNTKFNLLRSEIKLSNFGYTPIILLGLLVSFFLLQDILISLNAKANNEAGSEGLIKFLFFDHAFLFIAGVILMSAVGKSEKSIKFQKKLVLCIALIFMAIGIVAGSKASWLGILFFFFLLSYAYLRNRPNSLILFPSISLAILIIVAAPTLYFVTFFYRVSMTTSVDFNFYAAIMMLDTSTVSLLAEEIFYRLSAGGFDRFMLISTSFLSSEISSYGVQEYFPYMIKNLINLLMPGTPFIEAYAPTSQLFSDVIQMKPLDGEVSAEYLLRSINSQAYTIFGVFTVMAGWMAPVFIFLYNFIFCALYSLINHLILRMAIIYLYFTTLMSFGFEVAAGYTYHVIISWFFMYYFMLGISKIKFGIKLTNSPKI